LYSVVELEVGEHETRRLLDVAARAAQHGAHARDQLFEAERLGHVVVTADRQALDLLLGGVAGGQEDDRHVVPVGAEPLHDGEAVAVGQHHVEHHQVGPELLGRAEGVGSVGSYLDAESFVPQGGCDEVGDGCLVVDDEHSGVSHVRMVAPSAVDIL
jgi:hypothetical protein